MTAEEFQNVLNSKTKEELVDVIISLLLKIKDLKKQVNIKNSNDINDRMRRDDEEQKRLNRLRDNQFGE